MVSERPHPQIQKEGFFRGILGPVLGPAISLRPLRLPLFPQGRETEIARRLVDKREPLPDTPDPAWDARCLAAEVTDIPPQKLTLAAVDVRQDPAEPRIYSRWTSVPVL